MPKVFRSWRLAVQQGPNSSAPEAQPVRNSWARLAVQQAPEARSNSVPQVRSAARPVAVASIRPAVENLDRSRETPSRLTTR